MNDYFAVMDEPRLPWLDTERLKSKFITLSTKLHPDRVRAVSEAEQRAANERYAELNAAYTCLCEPKERLRHLLELERGVKPTDIQGIPASTMDLQVEVGRACREADSFLAERAKAKSPLLLARYFEQGLQWIDRLNALQERVRQVKDELLAELEKMNAVFESAPRITAPTRRERLPLEGLEQIYRMLSYVSRWSSQIQERLAQLSSNL